MRQSFTPAPRANALTSLCMVYPRGKTGPTLAQALPDRRGPGPRQGDTEPDQRARPAPASSTISCYPRRERPASPTRSRSTLKGPPPASARRRRSRSSRTSPSANRGSGHQPRDLRTRSAMSVRLPRPPRGSQRPGISRRQSGSRYRPEEAPMVAEILRFWDRQGVWRSEPPVGISTDSGRSRPPSQPSKTRFEDPPPRTEPNDPGGNLLRATGEFAQLSRRRGQARLRRRSAHSARPFARPA